MMQKEAMPAESMPPQEMSDDGVSASAGAYIPYTADKLAMAETGDVVLFFHGSWCPSCRGLHADIETNRAAIPADVTIMKVDYDASTELKKKYGVTTQHTLVQVDAAGNMIKKWSGGGTLATVISEIQ
jgi:thiol-disulfide isomerase/thioredoxin